MIILVVLSIRYYHTATAIVTVTATCSSRRIFLINVTCLRMNLNNGKDFTDVMMIGLTPFPFSLLLIIAPFTYSPSHCAPMAAYCRLFKQLLITI